MVPARDLISPSPMFGPYNVRVTLPVGCAVTATGGWAGRVAAYARKIASGELMSSPAAAARPGPAANPAKGDAVGWAAARAAAYWRRAWSGSLESETAGVLEKYDWTLRLSIMLSVPPE